ncbi:type II toxin-antitoxin system VapC family toxin [Phocaeicola coprophilus]|nr:type II toxin-antitoxin system VapC family toxin [Phocaeicola coprophilus]
MKQYLLDTNICISMFKNKQGIREKILDVSLTNCFVSEITLAELFYGAAKSGREEHFKDVEMVIRMFKVLPVYPCLRLYGGMKAELEAKGMRIDEFDLLIGATAVFNKMVMVTSNVKHFERIPEIQIENW